MQYLNISCSLEKKKKKVNRYSALLDGIKERHYTYRKEWCTTETSTHASNKAFVGL